MLHLAHDVGLSQKRLYALLNVVGGQSVSRYDEGVISDDYILGGSSAQFHFLYFLHPAQLRNHLPVHVVFQLIIPQVGIHAIGQQHLCRFFLLAFVHDFPPGQFGKADSLWQLFVCLSQNGGNFKLCH